MNLPSGTTARRLLHASAITWLSITSLLPFPALAAPFCVQTLTLPPQCLYVDPQSCNKRALQLDGWCTANPDEVHVSAGFGHYCLITPGMVTACDFVDRGNCDAEARHQGGVCISAPAATESPSVDPYRNIRPLNGQ